MYDKIRNTCCPGSNVCDMYGVINPNARCQDMFEIAVDFIDIDPYNIYQQCYQNTVASFGSAAHKYHSHLKEGIETMRTSFKQAIRHKLNRNHVLSSFFTQQGKMNYASTDENGGYVCYMTTQIEAYLNQRHVRDALHVPDFVQDFSSCRWVLFIRRRHLLLLQ